MDFWELPWYSYLILILIGSLVGWIGGFWYVVMLFLVVVRCSGIGGAPFMVALLRVSLKFCQHDAQGTVLAVMLPPMSLLGVWVMKDRAIALWKYSFVGFVTYAIASYVGALAAFMFSGQMLSLLFGIFLIVLAMKYIRGYIVAKREGAIVSKAKTINPVPQAHDDPEKPAPLQKQGSWVAMLADDGDVITPASADKAKEVGIKMQSVVAGQENLEEGMVFNPNGPTVRPGGCIKLNYLVTAVLGGFVGVVGGMFGIGAGVLMVPIFSSGWVRMDKNDARVLSLSILLPPVSAGAVYRYSSSGDVDWWMAAAIFILYFVSNPLGSKYGRDISTLAFKGILGVSLALLGIVVMAFGMIPSLEACDKS